MSGDWRMLAEFRAASEPGGEREVVRQLGQVIADLQLTRDELDRLSTAVAETVMNAMEHGNDNDPRLEVDVIVNADDDTVEVLVSDNGGLRALPEHPEVPDLEAKLDGLQRPRGWGLFLIRNMVDSMDVVGDPRDPTRHTARLRLNRTGPAAPAATEEAPMSESQPTFGIEPAVVPGGTATIRLGGDIDGGAKQSLPAAYAAAVASGEPGTVLLDFSAVGYINSTGIAVIVGVLAQARADRRTISATGLSEHYRHIFTITRLVDFIQLVDGAAAPV